VKRILLIFVLIISSALIIFSQDDVKIKKSQIIENIAGKDYYLHFVKQGENLYEIARTYEITVDDIFNNNPVSIEGIKPGQILKIPITEKETIPLKNTDLKKEYFFHIVKTKETLYGISRKYGVEISEIKSLNPEMGEYPKEGETIKIPVKKNPDNLNEDVWNGITVKHIVKPGETLYGIAKQYNVTTGEILNANAGLTDQLKEGMEILIPNQVDEKELAEIKKQEELKARFDEHTVIAGETLYHIATDYGVSIDTLKNYNSGLTAHLSIGQIILIPKQIQPQNYIYHTCDNKGKLKDIAYQYGVDYYKLLALNPGVHKKVAKGQVIKIPVEIREMENENEGEKDDLEMEEPISPCEMIEKNIQSTYNVALMLPLFLEELDSIETANIKDRSEISNLVSFRFLQFYEGFLMAVDSLKEAGMNLNLFVYDVDNTAEKTDKVLLTSELSSMDLIIGPFYSESFKKVADFARIYQIKIVNPLSTREEIIFGNPYVFKVKPGESFQIDKIVSFIQEHYAESNVVIVRHNKYKYQADVSYIRNYLNSNRNTGIYISNKQIIDDLVESETNKVYTENILFDIKAISEDILDSTFLRNTVKEVIYVNDSTTGLNLNISLLRKNIVIAFSEERVFTQEILSRLNKLTLDHDITLFMLPEWKDYEDSETEHLLNLDVHCFTSSQVDYTKYSTRQWILDYRKNYNTEPTSDKFAFDGFDIGWYFLNALYLYGGNFEQCIENYDIDLIQSKFEFEQIPGNGFQNTYWNIGKYYDYNFIKVKN